jgi:superfamily I DNA/RNA helicase
MHGQDDYGEKGTLMIVGDPKQSIYRWRGGKAEQFIELSKDNNPFNPDKKLEHLDKNYRSYSQVMSLIMNFSSCCHQNLNNQITKIYTRITVTRSLMINWVVTLISPLSQRRKYRRG